MSAATTDRPIQRMGNTWKYPEAKRKLIPKHSERQDTLEWKTGMHPLVTLLFTFTGFIWSANKLPVNAAQYEYLRGLVRY